MHADTLNSILHNYYIIDHSSRQIYLICVEKWDKFKEKKIEICVEMSPLYRQVQKSLLCM